MGGSVSAGQPYLVGERGPELFMPGRSGGIAPAGSFGGGVQVGAVNITVQNTGENLSPAAQKQIASQVQGIVMATLVNQKRSGGIL
jgi:phage-related minor tail protein